ncbi:oligosaccharide flippase family protein [Mycobacterium crocinum]|uniref:Oligosaccharide flippase family protein n=1 Tax=Mycolicibacterium crocinum TaxID=388459 RepID=A0ABY3TM76_9MYCO|nr:oligosaccharide flippase family protein [Mycolicibacterium crocinum]MCV7215695.1 oligosaccharide flippase family protein [Mycolicibacterium crocinum]ULN42562.1 oligosaccharide flippase family protein [Mycolicibacterium crocinum]
MSGSAGSKLKALASYAGWMLGAQVATAMLQFGYAAVTSRLVPGAGFGAYAVALNLAAVVSLIAQGGLGLAAARTPELRPGKLSFLILFAVGLGIVSGFLLVVLARPWAALWDVPEAIAPARVVGITAFFAPLSGLLLGLLRRLGEFRLLAISTVVTSAIGMGIGVVAVLLAPGPVTLLISPVVATILLTIVALVLTRRQWWARPEAAAARTDLGFAWRALGLTMLSYLSGTAPKWSVSRWVGADALGQWNRADVLTAVPIEQILTAFGQAVYPEFRHDIGAQSRRRQAWTDYLLLVAWACFPVSAILAGLAPIATAILFGPGWGLAASIAPLVAIQYAFVAVETALAKALESVGRFRLLVPTALASLTVVALGAVGTALTGSWAVALVALIGASILRHLLQLVFSIRVGALDGWSLAKGYGCSLSVSAILGGSAALVSAGALGGLHLSAALGGAGLIVIAVVSGIVLRRQLPPVQILARYRSNG